MRLSFCSRDVNAARRDLVRICTELRDELESDATLPDVSLQAGAPDSSASPDAPHPRSSTAGSTPRIAAAIYVSCAGRGGPHFGSPSAEARMLPSAWRSMRWATRYR
jgi:FIST C domain